MDQGYGGRSFLDGAIVGRRREAVSLLRKLLEAMSMISIVQLLRNSQSQHPALVGLGCSEVRFSEYWLKQAADCMI